MGKRTIAFLMAAAMTMTGISVSAPQTAPVVEASDNVSSLAGASVFDMTDVTVTDDYYSNSLTKEIAYLKELDENKLLAGFKETAGYAAGMSSAEVKTYMGTTRYTGGDNWENSLIGGHTLGHYMTALSQAVVNPGTPKADKTVLEQKLDNIVSTLKECQEKTENSSACKEGYIFGATLLGNTTNLEFQFDNVEVGKENIGSEAWVPWYTMHKILAGLVTAYELTGNTDALSTAQNLGDWTYNRASKWSDSTRKIVLGIEYGGMNDALYELAKCTTDATKQNRYLVAAALFDETVPVKGKSKSLYQGVLDGDKNWLNELHANTTVPKFLGALNRYVVLSKLGKLTEADKIYLEYAEAFWDMVVNKHSYITGGNSEWEHFGRDNVLDSERTNCNNETCNTYNMLKLSRQLFMVTGKKKYADFYEKVLINAIMASQNPESGMSMYFQPMKSGYFKVYSTKTQDFWCCTGSGMENFTKLNDSIYYYKGNNLIVNQYRSSVVNWKDKGLTLTQEANLLTGTKQTFTVTGDSVNENVAILFRIPDYAAGDVTIQVDGSDYNYTQTDGYAKVEGPFADGTVIEVTIPEEVTYENLTDPDATETYGFKYGPFVLAADLGTQGTSSTDIGATGVTVDVPKASILESESIQINVSVGQMSDWLENINEYMVKKIDGDSISFEMKGTDHDYTFVPYYQIYQSRYGIYWNFSADENGIVLNAKKSARDKKQLDVVQPGYGQNELDEKHAFVDNGSTGDSGILHRYANAEGSFSYRMVVSEEEDTTLACQFLKEENGKTIKITVGNKVIAQDTLDYDGKEDMYTKFYTIPKETALANIDNEYSNEDGERVVRITFASNDDKTSATLCGAVYTYEAIGTVANLVSAEADKGDLTFEEDTIKVFLAKDDKEVGITFELEDDNGYITFDGKAFDETKAKKFDMGSVRKLSGTIRVYAEDFTTYKDYKLLIQKDYEKDESVEYFVDCGDLNVTTVSSGDLLGKRNSVTEQAYGTDPVTGYKWGIVDSISTPLMNGSSNSTEDAVYTDQTWPYENGGCVDGDSKMKTNRYTKNQFENGVAVRFLDYAFELDNGDYNVEVGFANPWNCSNNPNLYANLDKEDEVTIATHIGVGGGKVVKGTVTVTDGELTLNARSDANDSTTLAINIAYIKISKVVNQEESGDGQKTEDKQAETEKQQQTQTETKTDATASQKAADTTTQTTTSTKKETTSSSKKTMKLSKVKVKKGKKTITGYVSVKKATVKIKVGKKAYKKATVKGKKFTLKTGKLKKGTKVTIKVTKSGYKTLTKKYTVK